MTPIRPTFVLALALLAGCGADGAPQAPAAKPGLSISGYAETGIVGRP